MSSADLLRRVIAIANGKGGVGKTSLTANMGGLLADGGYRVLLVDLDPQGNLARDLGYQNSEVNDYGQSVMASVVTGTPFAPVTDVRPRLDVVPGGARLSGLSGLLTGQRSQGINDRFLPRALAPIAERYDMILLDCPPGEAPVQEEALSAARWLIIPTKSDSASRGGLATIAERYQAALATNPDLQLLGVVLFGVNPSARRLREDTIDVIEQMLGDVAPVFTSTIRHAEKAAVDARERGQLIHELEVDVLRQAGQRFVRLRGGDRTRELAASAPGLAGDYQQLTEEIVTALTDHEAQQEAST